MLLLQAKKWVNLNLRNIIALWVSDLETVKARVAGFFLFTFIGVFLTSNWLIFWCLELPTRCKFLEGHTSNFTITCGPV